MYRDAVPFGCIAVRVGKVGIIYVSDGGAQERQHPGERPFKGGKRSNQPLAYRFEGEF